MINSGGHAALDTLAPLDARGDRPRIAVAAPLLLAMAAVAP